MFIKINDKVICIPPYISTGWSFIAALRTQDGSLVVQLIDGENVFIPGLDRQTIESVFMHHAGYLEKEEIDSRISDENENKISGFPELFNKDSLVKFTFNGAFPDHPAEFMQHNPDRRDAPDLPEEVLLKISAISRIIVPSSDFIVPQPEVGCNCFHCQIGRALRSSKDPSGGEDLKEEVREEDLQFRQWDIVQSDNRLFSVVNRLDDHEKYTVFLGEPVGCTCGKTGCEHLLAVLKS